MSRILLLGAGGQVGSALHRALAGHELHAPPSAQLDLADADALREAVRGLSPRLILNAAAYTAVDRAEEEPEQAEAINARAPRVLSEEAAHLGAVLVHYSTDYVFDGTGHTPYTEQDAPHPLNVYGRTKLAGDEAVLAGPAPHWVLRTSWVYALQGRNFLLTMQRLLRERDELQVVDDQIGAPTWAESIAEATVQILCQNDDMGVSVRERPGLYHMSCAGETSWCGFARAIRRHLIAAGERRLAQVRAIATEQYPTPAKRPRYSVLDNGKLAEVFGLHMPHWEEALAQAVAAQVRDPANA